MWRSASTQLLDDQSVVDKGRQAEWMRAPLLNKEHEKGILLLLATATLRLILSLLLTTRWSNVKAGRDQSHL
jgi:hypothetical protein